MRVAALTMAYNEPVWAAVWTRYYVSQVGAANCYMLDHGSSDGSTDGLGICVERLPRSPLDEGLRASQVADFAAHLLKSYDAVVHSDVDELVLADPMQHRDLRTFAARETEAVVTTVGLDLQHLPGSEPPLDPRRPIGEQRRWVRFSAAMCKPAFIRRTVAWQPGFHGADAPLVLGGLYLVHLRYADLDSALLRLARTRSQAFSSPDTNRHQRVGDDEFAAMMSAIASLPREEFVMDIDQPPLRPWLNRLRAGASGGGPVLTLAGDRLWRLPDRIRGLF